MIRKQRKTIKKWVIDKDEKGKMPLERRRDNEERGRKWGSRWVRFELRISNENTSVAKKNQY